MKRKFFNFKNYNCWLQDFSFENPKSLNFNEKPYILISIPNLKDFDVPL